MNKNSFRWLLIFVFWSFFTIGGFAQERKTEFPQNRKSLQTYTLRCRGGSAQSFPISASYPLPESADQTTAELFLRFDKSLSTNNLSPGECSWLDRTVNKDEPTEVRFVNTPQIIKSIVDKMASSNIFSDFMVYNTNKGYFLATEYKLWSPIKLETKVIDIFRRGSLPEPVKPQKITNVYINPSLYDAKFSFLTVTSGTVLVEISTRKPNGLVFEQRFVVASRRVTSQGSNRSAFITLSGLKPGQHYFYSLSVVEGNGANDRLVNYFGDFYTQVRID
jgi:hypothetical protein